MSHQVLVLHIRGKAGGPLRRAPGDYMQLRLATAYD
jgi:hypothetical protein